MSLIGEPYQISHNDSRSYSVHFSIFIMVRESACFNVSTIKLGGDLPSGGQLYTEAVISINETGTIAPTLVTSAPKVSQGQSSVRWGNYDWL
ncbi:hypothetical protein [Vibrio cincinnatiensis]|uniref:hypothetical protein n=1 Tax=Vibrio cincinnatiensis TaxID=675 RepID=UPI0012AD0E93|nr:hypothetical protein [Vibrio cincinnatiensis]